MAQQKEREGDDPAVRRESGSREGDERGKAVRRREGADEYRSEDSRECSETGVEAERVQSKTGVGTQDRSGDPRQEWDAVRTTGVGTCCEDRSALSAVGRRAGFVVVL